MWGSTMNCCIIFFVCLQDGMKDYWDWNLDHGKGYTVNGVYHMLSNVEQANRNDISILLWTYKNVPLKVSMFVWRLLRNRIPMKDNLTRRGIKSSNSNLCLSDCGLEEHADHLFLGCAFYGSIWSLVRQWLGICSASPLHLSDHLI